MKVKLKEICTKIHRGKTPKYTEKSNVLVFAQKCNLQMGGIDLSKALCLDTTNLSKWQKDDYLFENDILINSTGTGTLGRVGFFDVKSEKPVVPDTHVTVVRIKDKEVYPKWVFYCLKSKQDYLISKGHGSTKQQELATSEIEKVEIPCPSFDFQRKSALELDTIQSAVDNKRRQLSLLDELVRSRFAEMFGDDLDDVTKKCKVSDVCTAFIGLTYKPTNVAESGTIVLRSGNIQNQELYLEDDIVRVSDITVKDEKYIKDKDILMCSRNGSARLVGKSCLIRNPKEKMSFGAFMTVIRTDFPYFMQSFFSSDFFKKQLVGVKTASINQITTSMLYGYETIKIDTDKENQFACFVRQTDRLKSVVKRQIKDLRELLDGKMQEYFG